jgi:hypothetical protein
MSKKLTKQITSAAWFCYINERNQEDIKRWRELRNELR